MRTLVLIRHAKSSWKDPGRPDFDRPLTRRGKADAPEMGRRLAARGPALDVLMTSPARRARRTAVGLAEALGIPKSEVLEEETLYHAPVGTLVAIVHRFQDEWDVVGMVGHNPGFSDLAEYLSDFGSGTMATCGVMAIRFDVDSWGDVEQGSGKVAFYDYPKNPNAGTS